MGHEGYKTAATAEWLAKVEKLVTNKDSYSCFPKSAFLIYT